MADERHDPAAALGSGIDYKTLFMGACFLITVLSGAIYRVWDSRSEQATEDTRTTNQLQWERIQQLSDKLLDYGSQVQQLRREADDREARIRKLEEWRYGRH